MRHILIINITHSIHVTVADNWDQNVNMTFLSHWREMIMLNESCPTIELKHQRAHNSLVREFKTTTFYSDFSIII